MRPDFEHMTIAELRAYCAYIQKVCISACEIFEAVQLVNTPDPDEFLMGIQDSAQNVIQQFEVLGIAANKKINQKGD